MSLCFALSFSLSHPVAPAFDYDEIPAPLSESENTITVLLRPALARGAPVRCLPDKLQQITQCLLFSFSNLLSVTKM